jgi:preprotein translocase subunit SecE
MKLADYIKDTRGEMRHVTWPGREQVIAFTIIVIAISIATAIFLGLFDLLFSKLLSFII